MDPRTGILGLLCLATGLSVASAPAEEQAEVKALLERMAEAGRVLNEMVLDDLMAAGVSVRDPRTTWVDPRAEIGSETVLEPGVVLKGNCRIGAGAVIGANCVLDSAAVGAGEKVPPLTFLTGA